MRSQLCQPAEFGSKATKQEKHGMVVRGTIVNLGFTCADPKLIYVELTTATSVGQVGIPPRIAEIYSCCEINAGLVIPSRRKIRRSIIQDLFFPAICES